MQRNEGKMICTSMESPANPTPTHFQNEPAKIDLKAILEATCTFGGASPFGNVFGGRTGAPAHRGFKIARLQSNDS